MKKLNILFIIVIALLCSMTACSGGNNSVIFSTEYEIEDYCEDAIIVSKSDGKVYGLLNNKGKEILPLTYDDLDFMNKENFCNGHDDTLYIIAEYEDENIIFDTKGKELLRSNGNLSYINFELDCKNEDNAPFFYESVCSNDKTYIKKYKFYNQKCGFLSEVNNRKKLGDVIWLSNKCYIDWSISDTIVYDYNGKEMHRFDNGLGYKFKNGDKYNLYLASSAEGKELQELIIGADGSIQSKSDITFEKYKDKFNSQKSDENKKYNLYKSNDTWKLEDFEGNALYEERYFERLRPTGNNDCVALTNEDNQICIIGRTGVKYVDFGILEYVKNEEKIYFLKGEEKKEIGEIYEGKKSVIIPVKNENMYDVYFYGEK